ncbi:MAG: glycosyltransferase family A protein [Nanoarchaeota archaeon]
MVNAKILVGCPIYDKSEYCFDEFLKAVRAFDYDNFDILIIDNSRDKDFYNRKLKDLKDVTAIYLNLKEEKNLKRLALTRNEIINYFLGKDYEYLLMMDSDVIAPPYIIKELLLQDKDIISGLYFNYFVKNGKNILLPVAWRTIEEREFEMLKKANKVPYGCSSKEDIRVHLDSAEYSSNRVFEVIMPSAGCMLVKRTVLEKGIRYGVLNKDEIRNAKKSTSDDVYFMREVFKNVFKAYCHTGIKCKHLLLGKYRKDEEKNEMSHPLYK